MKKITALCVLLFTSVSSWSFTPESGFYWNPDESGSGYSIEIQDNILFAAFYVYDDLGIPFWYTTSGEIDGNAFFEGAIYISEDGPCLACTYTPNNTFASNLGTVQINFTTETTATMSLLGETIFLERHNFFLGDELQKMRGEWQVVSDMTQYIDFNEYPYFADVLVFEQTEIYEGTYLATGCRSESTVDFIGCTDDALFYNNIAASVFEDQLLIVVDHSSNYFLTYVVETGTDQFDGAGHYYHKGSGFDPTDTGEPGYLTRGFRSASKTFVDTGSGPSKSTASKVIKSGVINLPETNVRFSEKKIDEKKEFHNLRVKLEQYLTQKREKLESLK